MKSNPLVILAMLIATALPNAALAAILPYPSLAWQQFPTQQTSQHKYDPASTYWDWDPSAYEFESYSEYEQAFGETYAMATCQVYDPLLIAAAYYSTDGNVYITREPTQLIAGQQITLTWQLPRTRDEGVSRVLLLNKRLSDLDWEELLANPLGSNVWRGIVSERWIERQPAQFNQLPWEDVFRSSSDPPVGFDYDAWPACRVWLQSDLNLIAKDCWIDTDCQTSFSLDEYGPSGRWLLDWSNEFVFGCNLPLTQYTGAILVLTGNPKTDYINSADPSLQIECNGWQVFDIEEHSSFASSTSQQYYVDVGQYIQAGGNEFSLYVNASSGGILQLESIELWVR